jgi:hypothetical protein
LDKLIPFSKPETAEQSIHRKDIHGHKSDIKPAAIDAQASQDPSKRGGA